MELSGHQMRKGMLVAYPGTTGRWQLVKASGGICLRPSRAPRVLAGLLCPPGSSCSRLWTEAGKGCRSGDGKPRAGKSSRVHLAHETLPSLLEETTPTERRFLLRAWYVSKPKGPVHGLEMEEHAREMRNREASSDAQNCWL